MTYIKAAWFHNNEDDPVLIYSEITDSREEIRKVHIFANGTHEYANSTTFTDRTELSYVLMPTSEEWDDIAKDPEFNLSFIEADEFETIWRRATQIPH